ncbi:Sodium-dependent phosphate transporter 1-A [Holothuria leucospilota]|uniref:Phosphate transporter n=1 Tax=Holothuria leucospilota TaxID=206669 RepID=A0A9Q0YGR7_HOLLE|nr:Sodium-dependent phosphate transporter 1-A [Holothuria leucospilota]
MMLDTMTFLDQEQVVWILIAGFFLTFLLSFSIGANSVANAFGTSVGSKVLSHFQAVILAAIFMTLGGVIIGPEVANTIENNIVDIRLYELEPEQLMLGQLSVILACTVWKFIATAFKLPVAATHSAVGAVVGFHYMATGIDGIKWVSLLFIGMSWVTSPLLSGIVALVLYVIVLMTIVEKENPLESGARTLPIWFGSVIFVNVLSVHLRLKSLFEEFAVPWYLSVAYSFGTALLAAILVWFCFVPRLTNEKKPENEALLGVEMTVFRMEGDKSALDRSNENDNSLQAKSDQSEELQTMDILHGTGNPDVAKICTPLLVVSVIFSAFAYGSILVSIGVAPLITIWDVYKTGNVTTAVANPFWMFLYGSFALTLGFAVIGGRVTETIGEGITPLSPSSAFPIELGATTVLLLASNLGIPVSTAHCKIGAIAAVGCYNDEGVDLKLIWKILLAWVVTLPATTGLSAGFMALFQFTYQYTTGEDISSNNTSLLQGIL